MAISDKERIDKLEEEIKAEPFVLWDGNGKFPGGPGIKGLGLLGLTLRERIDSAYFGIAATRQARGVALIKHPTVNRKRAKAPWNGGQGSK